MKRHRATPLLVLAAALMLAAAAPASSQEADELDLPDSSAFAIGTPIEVQSVASLEANGFNQSLHDARIRKEPWSMDPIQIALRFIDQELSGSRRTVTVQFDPTEWERDRKFNWAKVVIEDDGRLDDSVAGERYVLWLIPDDRGRFRIKRALRAQICSRAGWSVYSSEPCP